MRDYLLKLAKNLKKSKILYKGVAIGICKHFPIIMSLVKYEYMYGLYYIQLTK